MPRSTDGSYSLPAGTLVNSGDTLLPSQHNPAMQDIAQALSNSLDRNGYGGMRAPLNLGGFPIQNVLPGSADSDVATVGQLTSIPVGAVTDFAGSAAPTGWLLCYGQAISRTTYASLFAAIGTAYGAGDGTTTFNVPDCRGRVSAGKDDMGGTSADRLTSPLNGDTLGASGGAEGVSITIPQLPAHNHGGNTGDAGGHSHNVNAFLASNSGGQIGAPLQPGTLGAGIATEFAGSHSHGIAFEGSGQAHPNVQPTIIFNKIIKAS